MSMRDQSITCAGAIISPARSTVAYRLQLRGIPSMLQNPNRRSSLAAGNRVKLQPRDRFLPLGRWAV
jgi:hypothetical protein